MEIYYCIGDVQIMLGTMTTPRDDTLNQTHLQITYPLIDSNEDIFVVTADERTVTCRRSSSRAAIDIDINTLSQLFIGSRTVDEVVACGDLDANAAHTESLAAIFPPQHVYVTDSSQSNNFVMNL